MARDIMEFIKGPVARAALINAAGYSFQYIDPAVDKAVPMLDPNSANGLGANEKFGKAALYSGIGLAAEYFLGEGKSEVARMAAEYGADFLYGLAGATIAADPVSFPKTFQTAATGGTAAAPSYSMPVGSVIS